jgi:hypothetical protein
MMALPNFEKQGWESFTIAGGFTDIAIAGEIAVLPGSSVVCIDNNGDVVTDTILWDSNLAIEDATLKVKVRPAGTEGASPYKITFRIKTSEDNYYEVDCEMIIKEY